MRNKINENDCIERYGYVPDTIKLKILNDVEQMRLALITRWEAAEVK